MDQRVLWDQFEMEETPNTNTTTTNRSKVLPNHTTTNHNHSLHHNSTRNTNNNRTTQSSKTQSSTNTTITTSSSTLRRRRKGIARRTKKDPQTPTKPRSARMIHDADANQRQQMREKHPTVLLNNDNIRCLLSAQWKVMEDDENKMYHERVAEDVLRYAREMDDYHNKNKNNNNNNSNNHNKLQQPQDEKENSTVTGEREIETPSLSLQHALQFVEDNFNSNNNNHTNNSKTNDIVDNNNNNTPNEGTVERKVESEERKMVEMETGTTAVFPPPQEEVGVLGKIAATKKRKESSTVLVNK